MTRTAFDEVGGGFGLIAEGLARLSEEGCPSDDAEFVNVTLAVDVGSGIEKDTDDVDVAMGSGSMKWRAPWRRFRREGGGDPMIYDSLPRLAGVK